MKHTFHLGLLFLAGLALASIASAAHGGSYNPPKIEPPPPPGQPSKPNTGPGDVGPGGSGQSGSGSSPSTGAPSSPQGPSTPTSPGATDGPGTQSGVPTQNPKSPSAASTPTNGPDLTNWQLWWTFNRDPYLQIKAALRRSATLATGADSFLGLGNPSSGVQLVSESAIRDRVVPALLASLSKDKSSDVITSDLMALAKIGEAEEGPPTTPIENAIEPFLKDPSQEVAETAAIALGVLSRPGIAPLLTEILADSPSGRDAVGRPETPYRTRAFAAYGLGLCGYRTANPDVRRFIVHHLTRTLESDKSAARDVKVACAIALGLVRLDSSKAPPRSGGVPEAPSASLETEIDWMQRFFLDRNQPEIARAYLPVSISHLCKDADPVLANTWKSVLCDVLSSSGNETAAIQQSAATALGLAGDNDDEAVDQRVRETLRRCARDAEPLTRRFAMIALARCAAREGRGGGRSENLLGVRRFLLFEQSNAPGSMRPWIALALGVLERARVELDETPSQEVQLALRSGLREARSPSEAGALSIACALAGDLQSRDTVLTQVAERGESDARAPAAIALGLMRDTKAVEPLRKVVLESRYKPIVLRDAAIGLGLLGDSEVVPMLVEMLHETQGIASQSAIASALGFIGDARSIDPLVQFVKSTEISDRARAFAAVALGIVCDKEPLPWNSKISCDVGYWNPPATLYDPSTAMGILDIL